MIDQQTAAPGQFKGAREGEHVGRVLDYGPAHYHFDKREKMSFYLVLEGANNGKPLWGKHLENAIEESRTNRGDFVGAKVVSRKAVQVDEQVRDEAGNLKTMKKPGFLATWEIKHYERPPENLPGDQTSRDTGTKPKEAVRNIPAERGARLVRITSEVVRNAWGKITGQPAPAVADDPVKAAVPPAPAVPAAAGPDIKQLLKRAQPETNRRIQALREAPARPEPGSEPLKDIHTALYAGLPGAGQYRSTVEGGQRSAPSWATRGEEVERRAKEMFVGQEEKLRDASHEAVIAGIATRFVGVVRLQAFDYGNMMVAKIDAEKAAERAGVRLNVFSMDKQRLNEAIRAGMRNDFGPMRKLVDEHAAPILAVSRTDSPAESRWSASYTYGQSQSPPAFVGRANGAERESTAAAETQRRAAHRPAAVAASTAAGFTRRRPARAYAP